MLALIDLHNRPKLVEIIPGIHSEAKGIRPAGGRVALGPHGKKCLLLAEAKGVLGGLGGVANGLGGRVEDRLALLGGVVVGARDGVGDLLGGRLLAGGLGRAGNVVGGALDGVTSLLKAGLLGVGLEAGGSLVGGGLAAMRLLVRSEERSSCGCRCKGHTERQTY
jgi:hypothetical protein